jgi:regulator of replication initiation timing
MREAELIQRISELEAQNLALVVENERLRDALGLSPKGSGATVSSQDHIVSKGLADSIVHIASDHLASTAPANETTYWE